MKYCYALDHKLNNIYEFVIPNEDIERYLINPSQYIYNRYKLYVQPDAILTTDIPINITHIK